MRAVGVQPEDDRHAGAARARDGKLHPVADGGIGGAAHAPDIALLDVLLQQHLARRVVGDLRRAVFGNFEGLVVGAVFLRALRHQADVGHRTHGHRVKRAMPFAEVDHLLVDARKGRFRHHRLDFLESPIGAVHLAAVPDHRRHGGIDDDVIGRMEIGDALVGIDHRQFRSIGMTGMQISTNFLLNALGQRGDLVVEINHAVVHVHAQLVQHLGVLGKRFLVEHAHAVAEHDGVRDLEHGRLDVQRKQHAGLARIIDLLLVKIEQCLLAEEHRIDHVAIKQADLGLEHDGLATLGDQLHAHLARLVQRDREFVVVKIAPFHVRDMGARSGRPLAHLVRMLARIGLDGLGRAAIGVALADHRVHRTASTAFVARANAFFFIVLGCIREIGNLVALALQLLDRRLELRHGGADVRQLDDVGIGLQRLLAELGQGVGHLLRIAQQLGELRQDAR